MLLFRSITPQSLLEAWTETMIISLRIIHAICFLMAGYLLAGIIPTLILSLTWPNTTLALDSMAFFLIPKSIIFIILSLIYLGLGKLIKRLYIKKYNIPINRIGSFWISLVVSFVILASFSNFQMLKSKLIEAYLIEYAKEYNKGGSIMLDNDTQFIRAEVVNAEQLVSYFSLPNHSFKDINIALFKNQMIPMITKLMCADIYVKYTLQIGAEYIFVYKSNEGTEILRFDLSQHQCN